MNEEKRQVAKDKGLPGKPKTISASIKPGIAGEKTDNGEKNTETDMVIDDLEDRLNNLFIESEDMSVLEDPGPKPSAALPNKEKGRDKQKITGAVKSKNGDDVHAKPQSPAPIGIDKSSINDFEIVDSKVSQKRLCRKKFVLGGILIVLAVAVSFIIFKPFARVEGDEQQKTVIAHKIDNPPVKIQAKTVNPSADTMIAKKAEPAFHSDTVSPQQMPEAKDAIHLVEKETDVFKAPAVSYPYSIHAGSYRSFQSAELSAETYRKAGLQAFWARVDLGEKGVWYRVFIDCYKDPVMAQGIIKEKQLKDARPIRVRYANFIGAYFSSDDLKKQSRFLSEKGYSPYFIQDDNSENYLYMGAFDTVKEAEEFSVELSSRGIRSLVVER